MQAVACGEPSDALAVENSHARDRRTRGGCALCVGSESACVREKSRRALLAVCEVSFGTMFRDAKLEGLVAVDPFSGLPRKLLPKPPRHERQVYSREEATTLLYDERVSPAVRVLLALMLCLGVRQGEACGRRWRDWDPKVRPLGSMNIETQYMDEPLKTDSARKTPVHPELESILQAWWDCGFELTFYRPPAPEDFIVPKAQGGAHQIQRLQGHGASLRAGRRPVSGCHLTRHTMIADELRRRRSVQRTNGVPSVRLRGSSNV
jgi:integrase